jgi:hypothetical protein
VRILELMNATIAFIALTAASTAIGLFVPRPWVRQIAVVILAVVAFFTVVFSMNDMRAHGSEAKKLGRSAEYISGMVERDQRTIPRRAIIFFSVAGLALVALVSARKKP